MYPGLAESPPPFNQDLRQMSGYHIPSDQQAQKGRDSPIPFRHNHHLDRCVEGVNPSAHRSDMYGRPESSEPARHPALAYNPQSPAPLAPAHHSSRRVLIDNSSTVAVEQPRDNRQTHHYRQEDLSTALETAQQIAASTNSASSWLPARTSSYQSSLVYQQNPLLSGAEVGYAAHSEPTCGLKSEVSLAYQSYYHTPTVSVPNYADVWRQQHQAQFGLAFAPVPVGQSVRGEATRKRPALVGDPPPITQKGIPSAATPLSSTGGAFNGPVIDNVGSKRFRPSREPQMPSTASSGGAVDNVYAPLYGSGPGRLGAEVPSPLDAEIRQTVLEMQQEEAYIDSLPDNDKLRHSRRLLKEQSLKLEQAIDPDWLEVDISKPIRICKRVLIPNFRHPSFNYVGRLLGTKGQTLQNVCKKFKCSISIMGEGSTKDRQKEVELLNTGDPKYAHYASPLHIRIDTTAPAHIAHMRMAGALYVFHRLLIPGKEYVEGITEKPSDLEKYTSDSWRDPKEVEERIEADELEKSLFYGDNDERDRKDSPDDSDQREGIAASSTIRGGMAISGGYNTRGGRGGKYAVG